MLEFDLKSIDCHMTNKNVPFELISFQICAFPITCPVEDLLLATMMNREEG